MEEEQRSDLARVQTLLLSTVEMTALVPLPHQLIVTPTTVRLMVSGQVGVTGAPVQSRVEAVSRQDLAPVPPQLHSMEVQPVQISLHLHKPATLTTVQLTEFGQLGVRGGLAQSHVGVEHRLVQEPAQIQRPSIMAQTAPEVPDLLKTATPITAQLMAFGLHGEVGGHAL